MKIFTVWEDFATAGLENGLDGNLFNVTSDYKEKSFSFSDVGAPGERSICLEIPEYYSYDLSVNGDI